MKKLFTLFLIVSFGFGAQAQSIFDKISKATKSKSGSSIFSKPSASSGTALSNGDIVNGLREALRVATDTTTKALSKPGGYFTNAAIKIVMPPEAKSAEKTLRTIGAGALVDRAIASMNTAAENAAGQVGEIFLTAIKQMTLTDGLTILRGGNHAATDYLKKTTTATLTDRMRPVILASLQKVNADKYWKDVFSKYNLVSRQKVETDLTTYVTGKALDGMFYNISLQEEQIRKDPAAQVTDILRKVFGGK